MSGAPRVPRVVILGGGACGMTAALSLVEAGAQVTVLEREPRAGGLCGTEERDGFRFDFGGHRFISRSAKLEALVRGLVGDDLLVRTRSSAVLHGGERYRYPLELEDVTRRFGVRRGARAIASFASARARQRLRPSADRTFEEWVTRRFGRDLYDAFFGPYTEKLWGLSPSLISADWASQRISLLSLSDVILRLAGMRRSYTRTYARRYLYPRLGIGQIFERMAERVADAGGEVALGARATGLSLSRNEKRIAAVRCADENGEREIACDAVISTVSLPSLARMIGGARNGLPKAAERAASSLKFRGIRLLHLMLDRPEVSPHTWMYVSEPRYLAARIQEPRHRSPDAAPPGQTSLMLEIPCDPGDPTWTMPEAVLADRCLDDLADLGLGDLRTDVIGRFSSFVAEGYPVYHLDYRRDREALLGLVDGVENLVTCGRQGAFRYVFMDTAMEMGVVAAEAVLGRASRGAAPSLGEESGLIEAQARTA